MPQAMTGVGLAGSSQVSTSLSSAGSNSAEVNCPMPSALEAVATSCPSWLIAQARNVLVPQSTAIQSAVIVILL